MTVRHSCLPQISIVVPSYNQGRFLTDTLESIFRQNYPNLEVVVMDGGSTDESVSVIKRYAHQLKHWQSEKDGGQSAAINSGMDYCSGDLVTWLNSDDFYWGNSLWTVGRSYAEYPKRGLYIGNGLRYNEETKAYSPFCSRHVALNRSALIHGCDYLLQPSVFFLREAWKKVGGLDLNLHYCMDWDILIRITALYPAVVLQEFLGVSREYTDTKSRSGKMKRAAEIIQMIRSHVGTEVTEGSLLFLFETLLDVTESGLPRDIRKHLHNAHGELARHLSMKYGGGHGFPERNDPQDDLYLPYALPADIESAPFPETSYSPTIDLIIPLHTPSQDFRESMTSIQNQQYRKLNIVIVNQGLEGDLSEVLGQTSQSITHCISDATRGSAHAINQGLLQTDGEIVGWLNPGDLLAEGALPEIARAFAADDELDLIYGNALTIDAQGALFHVHNGRHQSGLWLADPEYFTKNSSCGVGAFSIPAPTVFFRRRLLSKCGFLDENYSYIFDSEFFFRCAAHAKTKKIERIQALCRVGPIQRERRNKMLIEWYAYSRKQWPSLFSRDFPRALWGFLQSYMRRKHAGSRGFYYYGACIVTTALAVTRLGNPERWWKRQLPALSQDTKQVRLPALSFGTISTEYNRPLFKRQHSRTSFFSLVCAPQFDSLDVPLLRNLSPISIIELFYQNPKPNARASHVGEAFAHAIHTPESIEESRRDLIDHSAKHRPILTRAAALLRRFHVPILGPRYPLHITNQMPGINAYCRAAVQESLELNKPDFVFVSNQANPIGLMLYPKMATPRLVLIVHDLECDHTQQPIKAASRAAQFAQAGEAKRTGVYEKENFAIYDGLVTYSPLIAHRLYHLHGIPMERIHVLQDENNQRFKNWLNELRTLDKRTGSADYIQAFRKTA